MKDQNLETLKLWKCSYCGHNIESNIKYALEHTKTCKNEHDVLKNTNNMFKNTDLDSIPNQNVHSNSL